MKNKIPDSLLETGYCIVVNNKEKSFISKAIKWFTTSKWNHAGMIVAIDNNIFVFEMLSSGAVLTPFTDYDSRNVELNILRPIKTIDSFVIAKLKNYMYTSLGRVRYDFLDIVFLGIHEKLFKKWFPDRWERVQNRLVCSALVASSYNEMFPQIQPFKIEKEVTPDDLTKSEFLKSVGVFS